MELISLELNGFGSFAHKELIDFSNMKGLWLITGNTGAGKTTLFDAITFALYGSTSGLSKLTGKSSMGLRSDFINDKHDSYVELKFKQDGLLWTIRRTPAWQKTGNGSPTPETVSLRNEQESIVKIKEVDQRIQELLKLDLDQFRQLVMIAQNDFEKLVLETNQREAILRKLLKTDRFARFQELIKLEKNNSISLQKQTLTALQNAARQYIWDEEAESYDPVRLFLQNINSKDVQVTQDMIDIMVKQQWRSNRKIEKEKIRSKPLQRQKSELEKQHGAAAQLHHQFEKLANLAVIVQNENDETPQKKREKKELMRRKDALSIKQFLDDKNNAEEYYQKIRKLLSESREQFAQSKQLMAEAIKASNETATLEKKLKEAEAMIATLCEKLPLFQTLKDQRNMLDDAEQVYKEAQKAYKDIDTEIQKIQKQIDSLKPLSSMESKYADQAVTLSLKVKEYTQLVEQLESLEQDMKKYEADQTELESLLKKVYVAWEKYQLIHNQFLNNEYAVVVKELKPGIPCPICGSVDHPNPYKPRKNSNANVTVTARQDSDAQNKHSTIQNEYNQAKAALDELERSIQARIESLGLTGDISDLLVETRQKEIRVILENKNIQDLWNDAKAASYKIRDLEKQLTEYQKTEETLQKKAEEASGRYQQIQGSYQAIQKSMPNESEKAFRMKISDAEASARDYSSRITALRDGVSKAEAVKIAAEEKFKNFESQRHEAYENLKRMRQKLNDEMRKLHFDDEEDVDKMLDMDRWKVDYIYEGIVAWENDKKNHAQNLMELQEELKEKKDVDPDKIQMQIDEVNRLLELSEKQIDGLKQAYQDNQYILNQTREAFSEWQKAYEKAQLYDGLYSVALGPKGQSKTFEVYIQRYYFHHVIELANAHFRKMTDGMLELRLNSSNLDLNVFDFHTGKERPASSLSGGEKFKAALSMALSMSDEIRGKIPGIQLGMLFIDEGFGTLDSDSLNQAINTLHQLSNDSGRLVAVISHREEMTREIKQQIIVKKHKGGECDKGSYIEII